MDSDIDNIIKNSDKGELLENLATALERMDKVVVVLISDKTESDDWGYTSMVMTLGLKTTYEAYGILEVARQDLQDNDY